MKTISEQIAAFESKRAANVERMSAIMQKASEEGRTLDASETEDYDTLQQEVKQVGDHIARLREHEKMVQATATPVPQAAGTDPAAAGVVRGGGVISVTPNQPKGHAFTKYAMLLLASRGNLLQAAEMAKTHSKDDPRVEIVLRAAVAAGTTTDANWAGNLVQYQDIASEFIDLLRPMTILGKMSGFRAVPFNVRIPRQTAGATANWVGQGKPKPMSSLTFDTVTLQWSKIAVIVALTDELVRFSNPSAVALCQADLIQTISEFMDDQFLDPTVAAVSNVSPASILSGVTATPSTGTTVSAITTDIKTILGRFDTANQPLNSPYWVMNPRTLRYLQLLRTSQDIWAFPETRDGMLQGIPVIASTQVSLDYGSPSATYIALVNAGEILVADDGQVTLDVSREASLQFDSAPSDGAQSLVSLWQNNLIGLRAERYINWLKRRSSAAYFIDGVTF